MVVMPTQYHQIAVSSMEHEAHLCLIDLLDPIRRNTFNTIWLALYRQSVAIAERLKVPRCRNRKVFSSLAEVFK